MFGGAGSGKTTTLITLVASAVTADPLTQVYGIDCAGGRLGVLTHLPNTGEVVPGDERDRVIRVLRLVKSVIADRVKGTDPFAPMLLLLDGLAAFRDTHEHRGGADDPFANLIEIAASGRNVGVHVALASERSNGMPASLAASFSERIALRLTAEADYQVLGIPSEALECAGPGRALRLGSHDELQLALPGASGDTADTDAAIRTLASTLTEQNVPAAVAVPAIPDVIRRSEISRGRSDRPSFAIDTVRLEPLCVPESGFMIVTGPAGSGRTTAVCCLLEALHEEAEEEGTPIEAILIAPRRSSLRDQQDWTCVADDADSRDALLHRLKLALGGTVPQPQADAQALEIIPLVSSDATASEPDATTGTAAHSAVRPPAVREAAPFPAPGRRGIVVVEDIGGFDGTGHESALGALLKVLRRSGLTTIIEGENATLGASWELMSPLRGARWALALQPDANDSPAMFTAPFTHAQRSDFPPGRGFLIESGRRTGVHVALPDRS